MAGSAAEAVVTAVYGILTADTTYTNLATGGTYSDVPAFPTFPYAVMGFLRPRRADGMGTEGDGYDCEVRLYVYSTYAGEQEAMRIVNRSAELLHNTTPTMTGYVCPLFRFQGDFPLPDEDRDGIKVKARVAVFRAMVFET